MKDLNFATASELAKAIRSKRISAGEVLEIHLSRIRRFNPAINALVTIDEEGARRRAREADEALARGEVWGPLHGVPVSLKDCHSTAGMRTTCGYPPLADHVPQEDGTVAARLKSAGAVLIGKTNVPQLVGQPQTDNPLFGRTNNPWDLRRTPGGSSGGAAGLTPLDVGSDTGGSIRMPAHFCGVFGFKPTARRVSTAGHIPDLPGTPRSDRLLNACGPLARCVEDLALAFRILAGPDARDTEVPPLPIIDPPVPPFATLRIAWAPTFPGVPAARDIRQTVEVLAETLVQAGAYAEQTLPAISFEEQSALWTHFLRWLNFVFVKVWGAPTPGHVRSVRPPTGLELMHMAQKRDELILAWETFFQKWDVLICPAVMVTAFPHRTPGRPVSVDGRKARYGQINHHCFPFNLTGHPVVVLPVRKDRAGLPIGVQLVGRRWQDERLLAVAARVAEVTGPFDPPPGYGPEEKFSQTAARSNSPAARYAAESRERAPGI